MRINFLFPFSDWNRISANLLKEYTIFYNIYSSWYQTHVTKCAKKKTKISKNKIFFFQQNWIIWTYIEVRENWLVEIWKKFRVNKVGNRLDRHLHRKITPSKKRNVLIIYETWHLIPNSRELIYQEQALIIIYMLNVQWSMNYLSIALNCELFVISIDDNWIVSKTIVLWIQVKYIFSIIFIVFIA